MGKKKHKHEDRAEQRRPEPPFAPAQLAGIAATALEQVNTPAFRQLMAGALGAAAQAFDQRRPAAPPAPPAPPPPPIPPVPPAAETYRPAFATPEFRLPPETQQTIEQVAAQVGQVIENAATLAARAVETAGEALERWAAGSGGRGAPATRSDTTDPAPTGPWPDRPSAGTSPPVRSGGESSP